MHSVRLSILRIFDTLDKLQVLFGTPEFVAPEVVNFDRISFGTDMWSVYFMEHTKLNV